MERFEPERGRENMLFSRGGRIGKTVGFPEVRSLPLSEIELSEIRRGMTGGVLSRGRVSFAHSRYRFLDDGFQRRHMDVREVFYIDA